MKPTLRFTAALWTSLLALSCAGAPPARTVRVADLSRLDRAGLRLPLVIVFEPGDRIPLDVGLTGDLAATSDGERAVVVVKRRFWLRLDDDVRVSVDGTRWRSIDRLGGKLSLGYGIQQDGIAALSVVLETRANP